MMPASSGALLRYRKTPVLLQRPRERTKQTGLGGGAREAKQKDAPWTTPDPRGRAGKRCPLWRRRLGPRLGCPFLCCTLDQGGVGRLGRQDANTRIERLPVWSKHGRSRYLNTTLSGTASGRRHPFC